MSRRSIELLIEDLWEAANRLPGDFRDQHPGIEWKKIIGLRHRIVHDYFDIDVEIIWQILDQVILDFKGKLFLIRERLEKEKDKVYLGQNAKPQA